MDKELEIEAQLWAYIDGVADADERAFVEQLLAESADWRALYAELLETHTLLQQSELEEPSLRFTRNVMEAIAGQQVLPAARQYLNRRIIGGIGLVFCLMLVAALWFAFAQSGGGGTTQSPAVDISGLFSSNLVQIIIILNIVLGLFFLDCLLTVRRNARLGKL